MTRTLFDDMVRTNGMPARHTESNYAFLNRVDRPSWQRVRDQLDMYFRDFPSSGATDLAARFKEPDPRQHFAAWWELYLHAMYTRLGFTLAPHPEVPATGKRPDFLVSRNGADFYLEAATVFSGIVDKSRSGVRESWIFDLVNLVTSPTFHVELEFGQVGTQRPKDHEIVKPLQQWLGTLDPDDVMADTENGVAAPELRVPVRDWELLFTALPIPPEHRGGLSGRLLGIYPGQGGPVDDEQRLRKTLRKKADRYGELDKPFVIAVLTMSSFMDDEDVDNALFGSIAYQYAVNRPHDGQFVRQRDGLWTRGHRPSAARVSAVLVGKSVFPWNHVHEIPRLWINRWATRPLPSTRPFGTGTASETGVVTHADADVTASEVFGLAEDWPGPGPR